MKRRSAWGVGRGETRIGRNTDNSVSAFVFLSSVFATKIRYTFFLMLLFSVLVGGCKTQNGRDAAAFVPTTHPPTPLPGPSPTAPPTFTAIPSVTPSLTPTATETPSPTSTPTLTPTATPTVPPTATAIPINRQCPDPAPAHPEYQRGFLDPVPWPTPVPDAQQSHFWLSRPLPGADRFITNNWLPYGWDAYRYLLHNGTDVAEPQGTPLLAAADGVVVTAGEDYSELYGWRCDWYGHLVVVQLDDLWQGQPVYYLYGHVQNIVVEVGQRVYRGEPLAEIGMGGAALVPHLHLEVRVGTNEFGSTRNPMLWYYPGEARGVVAGRLIDPAGRPWQGFVIEAVGRSEGIGTETARTWSYLGDPQGLIKPDEVYTENFLFADMKPGRYELFVTVQGVQYRAEVDVSAAAVSTIEIVTEPYREPTLGPSPTPVPTAILSPTITLAP